MSETIKKACGCCVPNGADLTGAESASSGIVDDVQEARITVKGGYSPKTIKVTRGVTTRLIFDRQESSRCSEQLLIPAFGIDTRLPQNEATIIEFTPTEAGNFAFTCGMEMLRGEIVVD